jgi:hypothetical protein
MYPAPVLRAATNHNQARESEQYCSHSKNKAQGTIRTGGAIVGASPVSWRGAGGAMVAGELAGRVWPTHASARLAKSHRPFDGAAVAVGNQRLRSGRKQPDRLNRKIPNDAPQFDGPCVKHFALSLDTADDREIVNFVGNRR